MRTSYCDDLPCAGCDLDAHGRPDTCIAGFHYDLNFLTIHGKSRFPGLFVWLRDGRRVPVAIPQGCLLLQAGKQLEWLTAGHVRAGMHEVWLQPHIQRRVQESRWAQGQQGFKGSRGRFIVRHQGSYL